MNSKDRFWSKVDHRGDNRCWNWLGSKNNAGYGTFWFYGDKRGVHRIVYELTIGKIPQGKDIHHKCENRLCVNPHYLQAVTRKEHLVDLSPNNPTYKESRQTHCKHGHEFNYTNTYIDKKGIRHCKICNSHRSQKYKNKKVNNNND